MEKEIIDVSIEFGTQLKKYLTHFGLVEADIAKMTRSNTNDIQAILSGKKGIVLKTAEQISKVFGIRYFEMGNPNFPLPIIENLPERAKEAILLREKNGTKTIERNFENDIAGNLDKIIHETKLLRNPLTADEIRLHFPENIRDTIIAIRITDLLKKSGRDKIVISVGKKGKELLFQLKKFAKTKSLNIKKTD